jgi:ribA/ribD-fused uncharacterized protein
MIREFQGQYRFLSNFWPTPRLFTGKTHTPIKTLEHGYQACKTLVKEERIRIYSCLTPAEAKRLGKHVTLRDDWFEVKDNIMLKLLRAKFDDPNLKDMLLSTGDEGLIEGNMWHDNYWGSCYCNRCGGSGRNILGILLMQVREECR